MSQHKRNTAEMLYFFYVEDETFEINDSYYCQKRITETEAGASQPLVLHGNNDAEEGETVVGSSVNALTGVSMAVYKPQDYDAATNKSGSIDCRS